jgi:hypothetical protein
MRAKLKRGRLIPPTSLIQGFERLALLKNELQRIECQLFERSGSGSDWRASALAAHALFQSESRQLHEWLSSKFLDSSHLVLMYESYKLLDTLRSETDLDKHETELMMKLDRFFRQ